MGSLSMSADVYSFAMIMLELWTGEAIYKDIPAHQACCRPCLPCNAELHVHDGPWRIPQQHSRAELKLWAVKAMYRGFSACSWHQKHSIMSVPVHCRSVSKRLSMLACRGCGAVLRGAPAVSAGPVQGVLWAPAASAARNARGLPAAHDGLLD